MNNIVYCRRSVVKKKKKRRCLNYMRDPNETFNVFRDIIIITRCVFLSYAAQCTSI